MPTVTEGFYGLQDLASALSISSGSHTDDYTYHKALARALAALGSAFAAALPSIEHLPSSLGLYVCRLLLLARSLVDASLHRRCVQFRRAVDSGVGTQQLASERLGADLLELAGVSFYGQ